MGEIVLNFLLSSPSGGDFIGHFCGFIAGIIASALLLRHQCRKYSNYCVSKALVNSNPAHALFVLEDLTGIRSATERVRTKHRYVSVSWAFYDLAQKLKYKAARAGSKVIRLTRPTPARGA